MGASLVSPVLPQHAEGEVELQFHPRILKGRRASSVFRPSSRTISITETANLSSATTNISTAQGTIEFSHADVKAELAPPAP